eukprot:2849967-Rhodomonas_salina.1
MGRPGVTVREVLAWALMFTAMGACTVIVIQFQDRIGAEEASLRDAGAGSAAATGPSGEDTYSRSISSGTTSKPGARGAGESTFIEAASLHGTCADSTSEGGACVPIVLITSGNDISSKTSRTAECDAGAAVSSVLSTSSEDASSRSPTEEASTRGASLRGAGAVTKSAECASVSVSRGINVTGADVSSLVPA